MGQEYHDQVGEATYDLFIFSAPNYVPNNFPPRVGSESTAPVFEQEKIVHALDPSDCAAIVIGKL
jgi:hypothetical protein